MIKIRKSIFVVIGIALLTAGVFVYSRASGSKGGAGGPGKGARGGGDTVFPVKTQSAQVDVLHGYVAVNGEIESQNSVSVFPDVAGKVLSTRVTLGSKVWRGQVIAYVDPSSPGQNFKESPVYSPITGSVISTPLKNGTTVTTSTEITQVGDISNLQVTSYIPERYVALLKTGLKAEVYLEAYPGIIFNASVSRVSPVVDAESRTKEVVLTFDQKDDRVNAGMFGKVILYTEDYEGKVVIPATSIVAFEDEDYVFVVKADSTVERRKVTLGHNVDGIVQIDGVFEGEKVVVQGQTSLSDGSKVKDIAESGTNGAVSLKSNAIAGGAR